MADKKVKVWNRSKGMHTIVFSDGIRRLPIPPNSFQMVPQDEVFYVNATSKSFSKGILEVDKSETETLLELGIVERNPNSYTPEELKEMLSGSLTKEVKEKLSAITERHAFDKLIEVARTLDLPKSKIDFIEELTGMEVFNELVELKQDEKPVVKRGRGK